MVNTVSKMRGQVKSPGYPQAEGLLGECMLKYGRDLGEDTNFGKRNVLSPKHLQKTKCNGKETTAYIVHIICPKYKIIL